MKRSKPKKRPTSKSKPPAAGPEQRNTRPVTEKGSEYRLLIAPHYNERKQRETTRVVLETVKSFASFKYELTVEERITDNSISLAVKGLSAPRLNLPASGPARFIREYDELSGSYDVTVQGLDGKICTLAIRIRPGEVKLLRPPTGSPIQVVTDQRLWASE